jgi:hypothetical protein
MQLIGINYNLFYGLVHYSHVGVKYQALALTKTLYQLTQICLHKYSIVITQVYIYFISIYKKKKGYSWSFMHVCNWEATNWRDKSGIPK